VQAAREVILKLVTRTDVALQAALLVTTLPYALIKAMAALRVTDQAG
jgi:F420-dependent methylenetetrahydromethanopterin dehydrogenase